MRGSILVAALLVSLAGAAACGGGGQETTPTPTATTTTIASPSPVPTASATSTPTAQAPTATPTATSTPAMTPTPTVVPPLPARLITNGPRGSSLVALTFDMGGRVEPALDIMHWLIDSAVPATIFMTGAMAANENTDAGREVLRLIREHPGQFVLGNHSYSHPDFRDLTATQITSQLRAAEAAIAAVAPLDPRPWFRPPFGALDDDVLAGVGAAGYSYAVMWDVDTVDWRPESEGGPTAEQIVAKVAAGVRGGSIVIMHLGGYNTFEALPGILAALRANGLTPATLPEVLGAQ